MSKRISEEHFRVGWEHKLLFLFLSPYGSGYLPKYKKLKTLNKVYINSLMWYYI